MAIIAQRWPVALAPVSCEFGRSRNATLQVSPRSRKETLIAQGRPLWMAKLAWQFPQDSTAALLQYWLEAIDGHAGSVIMWDWSLNVPVNYAAPAHWVWEATVQVNGAHSAGATSLALKGLAASSVAAIQGGKVQVGRRLYVVAATVNSDGSGNATLTLTTPLLAAAANNDPAYLGNPGCEMRLDKQVWQAAARAGDGLISVSADFVETVADFS